MRTGKTQFFALILVSIVLIITLSATSIFGAVINVPTLDYPTIQAGIDAAVNGDTVLVADGTYTGDGNKNLDFKGKAITVISENGQESTIIDCEGEGRGFWFHTNEDENSVLSGFTITGGQADFGGGIACFSSSPTITNCIITENNVISVGIVDGLGGGIYCDASAPIINSSVISKNSASRYGGGIASENDSSPGITGCSIIENKSSSGGFGVYSNDGSLNLIQCTIQDNYRTSTSGTGGGIYSISSDTVITNCVISGHRAGFGGGINCSGGSLQLTDSTVSENEGTNIPNYGGGIICSGADVMISGCTISNNTAGGGGGIYCINSTIDISTCIIAENRSTRYRSDGYGGGGGIFCPNSTGTISSCLITKNTAVFGGGISVDGSAPNIINCTISQNTAVGNGSGDTDTSGGIYIRNSSPAITNCIFWENSSGEILVIGGSPAVTYSDVQNGWPGEGNISDNPEFVDPVNGDYHLKDYSPCIGAGRSAGAPAYDIEGHPRPNPAGSKPDMGAYENGRGNQDVPPPDIFGFWVGNVFNYQGTYPGGSYTSTSEVTSIDETSFPVTTHVIEHSADGGSGGRNWYETTPGELKLWGENFGDFYKFPSGLITAWYPMQVGDQRYTTTTVLIEGLIFDASMTVNVLTSEPLDLSFDTLEAYKLQYIFRVWGHGFDISDTTYRWVVPYLGYVKYQSEGTSEVLNDFAIGGGMITPSTDFDEDGLKDYEELIIYGTNFKNTDSDADGLSDGDEVNTYETDPNNNDSDEDGLSDGDEFNTHGTDPADDDTDNDGLIDGDEINTHNTDPTNADSDGDELSDGDEIAIGTDPNDEDTDGDTMKDGWEDEHDLDPLNDDADEDPDEDGLTNLQEYNQGRHPTNVEPDTPTLWLPDDQQTDVSLTPELETDEFSDTDEDDHAETNWQIGKRVDSSEPCSEESFSNPDYIVFDGTSDTQLTVFNVPDFLLESDMDYCWRARFTDTGNATSEWSGPFAFKTVAADEDDENQNGVPDDQEVDDPTLDLDNNGTPDANQGDMKCVNTEGGTQQIGLKKGNNVAAIDCLMWTDPNSIDDPRNRPGSMPVGLLSFRITVDTPGDTAQVTVHLSEPAPVGAKWYKYDTFNGWQDYSAHAVFSPDRTSVTLEFEDGGFGDADGVENAVIIDPSGPGALSSSSGGGSGGGGCFISAAASTFAMPTDGSLITLLLGTALICLLILTRKFKR